MIWAWGSSSRSQSWTRSAPEYLPLSLVTNGKGTPLRFRVSLRGHDVTVGVWRADVGRIPLYLLDTDLPENSPVDRFITAQLYVGDRDFRLLQYALLGIGGLRALSAMGIDPGVIHLNEGHAGFLGLEKLQAVSHAAEILLSKVRSGERAFVPTVAAGLWVVIDTIREILRQIEADGKHPDLLLATGDMSQDGEAAAYRRLARVLSEAPRRTSISSELRKAFASGAS